MKLSKSQIEIIQHMRSGWELGLSERFRGKQTARVQQGGLGKGGECIYFKVSTLHALLDRKLVACTTPGFPSSKYELTELGKSISIS